MIKWSMYQVMITGEMLNGKTSEAPGLATATG